MRTEMREVVIYDFPKTKKIVSDTGKKVGSFAKKIWGLLKPSLKKLLQKTIVILHDVVSKLEVYLLSKIDEVVIE